MDLVEVQQEEDEIETLNKMMKFYNRILLSRVVPFNLFQEMADSQTPTVTQPQYSSSHCYWSWASRVSLPNRCEGTRTNSPIRKMGISTRPSDVTLNLSCPCLIVQLEENGIREMTLYSKDKKVK